MNTNAEILEAHVVMHELAEVLRVDDARIIVATRLRRFEAQRSLSCCVVPVAGDVVVVAICERGAFITTVLDGSRKCARTIATEGDLAIQSNHGSVTIGAKQAIALTAEDAVHVASGGVLSLISRGEASLAARMLSVLVETVDADVDRLRAVARTVETVAEQCVRRVKRAFSFVEDDEQIHANRFGVSASSSASIHADHTTVTAKTLVKVDAEQVHLG